MVVAARVRAAVDDVLVLAALAPGVVGAVRGVGHVVGEAVDEHLQLQPVGRRRRCLGGGMVDEGTVE